MRRPVNMSRASYEVPNGHGKERDHQRLREDLLALEAEQQDLRKALADAEIYTRDPMGAARMHERDAAIEDELMQCLERWEELSS